MLIPFLFKLVLVVFKVKKDCVIRFIRLQMCTFF